ncbi:uncharacterized protein LOC121737979 [Aricia agestis]|uniref:uncharacterized protein LOC121737979 n=1 Tax=Aricia agestis TaxID=91739 RepID=UPI001C201D97|nr:uncharacterized protein LOC121737979 [Aricia agestis]
MSVSVEDVTSPLSSHKSLDEIPTSEDINKSDEASPTDQSEPSTPKPHPMAFTIDFGTTKPIDSRRLEELAKKSQARHQRVQSMSASQPRTSPVARPPMSAKLPRKAQGYNSEGYFSSDQEDSCLSGSVKLRNSLPNSVTSPSTNRTLKSPVYDFLPKRTSKSPIVDSIMSRSDSFSARQALNLPLKTGSYKKDVHRSPSYSNLNHRQMSDIIDKSPEGVMLTDISSPELDILTPDNGLSTPEAKSPTRIVRAMSETPDLLFKKCNPMSEPLYIDDDIDAESNHSSTGTYTIEGDNYTEEQKARMSIDRTFGADVTETTIDESIPDSSIIENHTEVIFTYPTQWAITKEPRRDTCLRNPIPIKKLDIPNKVSKDKNVLEISCCYESPTENDLATQTSKQIRSTRSYLEKIKNRVRTITEKTFAKSPPKHGEHFDAGTFTSVTTSGVLSSKYLTKTEYIPRRRCSLTKSEIDQTDYIHRLSRESSVPVSLPSNKLNEAKFESTALKNAQKNLRDNMNTELSPEQVGKLSYMSLSRCKGDKTWIQDWADSVKNYNNNTLGKDLDLNSTCNVEDRPPISPRLVPTKPRSPVCGTPTKIPSPVGTLLQRRTPDLIPPQDTESYLVKTQNAITNLQAKLHSNKIPSPLTTSLLSEKTLVSRLPVSQLSRSNSLNYRLRRKDTSGDSSPLRSPGHYVITGSSRVPESTKILLNTASRSLDTDTRDRNMNSPNSDRGLLSNSSDDKTLSNRHNTTPHRKTHVRHKSFEGRNPSEIFANDIHNANQVSLKAVLKNNALEANIAYIDQTRCHDTKKTHQRVYSDGRNKPAFGTSIRRSSSFSTVNRNNNIERSRRSSGQSEDVYSDESDNASYEPSADLRFKRQLRNRVEFEAKSIAPANSPRCPNTPEMQRKFGPGLIRNSVRVTSKERGLNRMSEPPPSREERKHQSRKISEPTRQAVLNRLTKSRSSTREVQPKNQEKGQKKPSQHRSSSALATKEIEFSNWKKRASYDPMKAAMEGKKRQMAKRQECNKDDLSSPSHSSPVHRSQSFHTTNMADLTLDSSDEEAPTLPVDMITSTHSDILDLRGMMGREYLNFQVKQPDKPKRRERKYIDDITPTKENIDFLSKEGIDKRKFNPDSVIDKRKFDPDSVIDKRKFDTDSAIDKRKTFTLDSDNSTTNGSSPRNSSIFSHEKSLTTCTSDTEGESGTESAPVVMRGKRTANVQAKQRYSGDYSMSSSTTSITQKKVQPRYLDISKYMESSPKNFLRRDPSKTYVGVLNTEKSVSKGSAQQYEMEQKKQELEKWKRRASYDPRKAAALGKTKTPKTASNVLRSQSFHGPMLTPTLRYQPPATHIAETYDASSDNDF